MCFVLGMVLVDCFVSILLTVYEDCAEIQCILLQMTNGVDAHENMCGCKASKCGGKVLPAHSNWFGWKSVCFVQMGEEKSFRRKKIGPKSTMACSAACTTIASFAIFRL